VFPDLPIHAVMGGLHLGGRHGAHHSRYGRGDCGPFDIGYIIAGHCTGWRALHALANCLWRPGQPVGDRHQLPVRRQGGEPGRMTLPPVLFTARPLATTDGCR